MTYWQIASGDGQVDLTDIFLKLNVVLIGPGNHGDFFDHKRDYENLSDGHLVRIFAEEVEIGDILILKRMVNPNAREWKILAIGEVKGAYRYEPIFENVDIDQWQMQHCRRVKWIFIPTTDIVVQGGGAPIRIQRLEDNNPLKIKAVQLLNNH